MKYSILDLKSVFDEDNSVFKVYFQGKLLMEVAHKGYKNYSPPRLVSHPSHTINEYLPEPYIIAGGYDNSDLYSIKGDKLTNYKFWSIIYSPIIYNDKEFFQVRTSKGKSGIMDSKGNIIIPFEYDEDIDLGSFIKLRNNGKLYVKKDDKYGVLDISGKIVTPFTDSWNKIKIQQLHDLNLWDDARYIVIDDVLYDPKYAPKL
jgi:hypothetical protein|nr:MAG TPA: WG containing repeat protein [Caudoviricetes sp.]